jgi:hypothetical protein
MRNEIRAARELEARREIRVTVERLAEETGVTIPDEIWYQLEHPRGNTAEQRMFQLEAIVQLLERVSEAVLDAVDERDQLKEQLRAWEGKRFDFDQLLEVKGIGPAALEDIKAHFDVEPRPEPKPEED